MCLVEGIMLHELVDRFLRLAPAGSFWNESWISRHREEVEVRAEAVARRKGDVEKEICVQCCFEMSAVVFRIG